MITCYVFLRRKFFNRFLQSLILTDVYKVYEFTFSTFLTKKIKTTSLCEIGSWTILSGIVETDPGIESTITPEPLQIMSMPF